MKKLSMWLFLIIVSALIPVGSPPADAQTPTPWATAMWGGIGSTAASESITGPATLHVTDHQCAGDRFTVLIDGIAVGATSDVPPPETCANASIDDACASGRFSSGSFVIPAGDHSVEVRHLSGFVSGSVAYRLGPVGCNDVSSGAVPLIGQTALCIEDDYVQATAQGARVGSVVTGPAGRVVIATGAPSCTFNCLDGFDLNCDGTIGDFCPVELDRTLVENVQPCLDAANPPATPEPAPAAAAPLAIPVGSVPLAHTGSETDLLSLIGVTMLGSGGLALVAARRRAANSTRRRG